MEGIVFNRRRIGKFGAIIRQDESRRYVVPSAPGKRFSGDTKVTDMLYSCYHLAIQEEDFDEQLDAIQARYQEIMAWLLPPKCSPISA